MGVNAFTAPLTVSLVVIAAAVCAVGGRIVWLGGQAESYLIDSDLGHMAGILETFHFDIRVKDFMSRL